jgi:hypothetical protein
MADGKRHAAAPKSEVTEESTPGGQNSKTTAEKSRYAEMALNKRDNSTDAMFDAPVNPTP